MRGVKYNCKFLLPNNEEITKENIKMDELCEFLKTKIKETYYIDMKLNNQIIYNVMKRPLKSNNFLRNKLKVVKLII
tara:strand:- start:1163 stop:1393 length:231 start_codon:yes stop_codon:yes gene_type:complete